MIANMTCVPGNDTASCSAPGSSRTDLAVGLTFFFVLLLIAAGVIVYNYHSKMRSMFQFGQRRSHKERDYTETLPEDSPRYRYVIREASTGENPIYENLATRTKRPAVNKPPRESEEDVYLQCDSPDEAIYSNDPACNLSILPDHEEDLYIMPDSL
uniref:Uncharacterized protein n=1 Tax=Gasterosteus aculeatus TaxID=69293 RepID=G3PS98_GASAC